MYADKDKDEALFYIGFKTINISLKLSVTSGIMIISVYHI